MSIYDTAASLDGTVFPGANPPVHIFTITSLTSSNSPDGKISFSGQGKVGFGTLDLNGVAHSDASNGTFTVGDYTFQLLGSAPSAIIFKDITLGHEQSVYVFGRYLWSMDPYSYPLSFSSEFVACFVAGTLLATPTGERRIETLGVGDLLVVADDQPMQICWIGRQVISSPGTQDPESCLPYRVAQDALGGGVPSRDTFLSGGHMIALKCLDEVLVPAFALANGCTIAQVGQSSVEYWHVELRQHSLVLANAMPCESFLDVGNKWVFNTAPGVHPIFAADGINAPSEACRPIIAGGPVLTALRQQILTRAAKLGYVAGNRQAAIRVSAGQRLIEPDDRGIYSIRGKGDGAEIVITSSTFIPQHFVAEAADRRRLGVRVRGISLECDDGGRLDLLSKDNGFLSGCSYLEHDNRGHFRWTDGCARIDLRRLDQGSDPVMVEIIIDDGEQPEWLFAEGTDQLVTDMKIKATA